jgi:hypothetical protein
MFAVQGPLLESFHHGVHGVSRSKTRLKSNNRKVRKELKPRIAKNYPFILCPLRSLLNTFEFFAVKRFQVIAWSPLEESGVNRWGGKELL